MPDPFYDQVIAVALDVPGVWLAEDQGAYGLRFTTERPAKDTVRDLIPRLHEQAWRTANLADRTDHSTLEVISEIDRTVNVYLTTKTA
jgi:hypothetical protein